jgi:phage-related minor tail protein
MPEEPHELAEHAEHAAHDSSLAGVTITMAILAVLVATSSLLGHRTTTEQLLAQTKATDQWAYYQAKDIRRRSYELFLDEIGVFTVQSSPQVEAVKSKYEKEIDRYKDQQKDAEAEARKSEAEVALLQRRADRYDLAEVMLEAALVICSITLLTRKQLFWAFGLVMGVCGVAIAIAGYLIH